MVRVHSECLTGDVFHSLRCDCGAAARGGARRGSRPRGSACCSTSPRRAAASACSTSCAPTSSRRRGSTRSTPTSSSGLPADLRDYGIGAQILVDLGLALDPHPHEQPEEDPRPRGLRARRSRDQIPIGRRPSEHNRTTCGPSATSSATRSTTRACRSTRSCSTTSARQIARGSRARLAMGWSSERICAMADRFAIVRRDLLRGPGRAADQRRARASPSAASSEADGPHVRRARAPSSCRWPRRRAPSRAASRASPAWAP